MSFSRCAALAAVLVASTALAKGEGGGSDVPCEEPDAPRAYAVRFPADEASPLVVVTNFGLLLSRDGGESFAVVCPQAMGLVTTENGLQPTPATPTVALLPGGALLATRTPIGLYRSEDGCVWSAASDEDVAARHVASMTILPPATLFATTDSGSDPLGVLRSDDGVDFSLTTLTSDNYVFGSVAAAADGLTVYATAGAFGPSGGQMLFRSDDAGESWIETESFDGGSLGIAGVDPLLPNCVLLRKRGLGFCTFDDALLMSDDGGASSETLLTLDDDAMTGAAIRPDGSIWVASIEGGLRRSTDGGQSWEPVPGLPRARCLAASGNAVLACLPAPDDTLGLVARTTDDGVSWESALDWSRIAGPSACVAKICAEPWDAFTATWIGATAPADGGAPAAADAGAIAILPDASPDAAQTAPPGDDGCGCA
ncbi:MAG: hypothetical protein AABZ30_11110, partial [Myxococcota bacterium]